MNFYLNWHRNYISLKLKACFLLSWKATITGALQTGGSQTGYCNIEKSTLYFIWKWGISISLKSKKNKKEGTVLKVKMPHLETCCLQTGGN